MNDNKTDKILNAIRNVRNETIVAHENFKSRIKEVQKTQESHTKDFNNIITKIEKYKWKQNSI